jgi:hypothetical protein
LEDHITHISKVLRMIGEYKLYVKKAIYEFARSEIMFFGHIVSEG